MRSLLPLALALAPVITHAQSGPAGVIRAGGAWIEVLPSRPTPGEVRTPEGVMRLEGSPAPVVGYGYGSFGIAPYRTRGGAGPPPEVVGAAAPAGRARAEPAADPCRTERERFLRRLLAMQGIDIDRPVELLEGLGGDVASGGPLLFSPYGLLPGLDPIRPLAFDLEARSLARELAACAGRLRG